MRSQQWQSWFRRLGPISIGGNLVRYAGAHDEVGESTEIVGVNFKNGDCVATDHVTLNGVPFAALAPDEPYKYLGVLATVMGDFSAENQYVLAEN